MQQDFMFTSESVTEGHPDKLCDLVSDAIVDRFLQQDPYTRVIAEYSRHSGAALSGKDPTRIDRIGAYAARYAARNVVAAGLAEECEVQLSYSIGQARPVSMQVQTFGTGIIPDDAITTLVGQHFDFRLASIIRQFQLRFLPTRMKGGFYQKLAVYGHVGRMDISLPWEVTDKAALLQEHTGYI